jgi:hypothetical protein
MLLTNLFNCWDILLGQSAGKPTFVGNFNDYPEIAPEG